jgi:thymidylate kinase
VIIELCGVPGAGKSTIAHELVGELHRLGQAASLPLEEVSPRRSRSHRLRRKLRRAAVETAGHPLASARTVRAVMRSRQPSRRDVAIRSLNWLVLRAAMRRASTTVGFHVIDQGLVQELCSLGFSGDAGSAIDVADPGAELLAPDLILVVEVELGLADQRLAARPGQESRVEGEGVDRHRELERQAELVEELLAAWMERFGDRIPTTAERIANGHHAPDVAALAASLRQERPGNRGATDRGAPADPRGALSTATPEKSSAAH